VVVDNRADDALSDILIRSGAMSFPSNTFTLAVGGRFTLDGEDSSASFNRLNLSSNASMNIGTASITAHEFVADSFSTNRLSITDMASGAITAQTAWFRTNAVLTVDASASGMSSMQTNAYGLISAGTNRLFAGSSTNSAASEQDLKDNLVVETTTSDRVRFIDLFFDTVGEQTVVQFRFTAKALRDYWDLAGGTSEVVTEAFADELDQLAGSDMLAIIDGISDPAQSLAAIEDAYFTTRNTFQTVLYGMQSAVGQSASRGAEFREQMKLKPSGGRGPQGAGDLRGWAKYYGQRYDHDAQGLNREYETDMDGGVLGVDTSLGGLLVGIGGGYGQYSTTYGFKGNEDINAYHGTLYGTLGMNGAYIDAGAVYGFNQVESRTSDPFVRNGEFDAQIISAYLGGGFDLVDSTEGMVFTPEASVQYSMYEQDGYTESGTAAVARRMDSFDADSLRTSLGLNVSVQDSIMMEGFSFKYDIRAHWIREFNPDPGSMNFRLEGGGNGYQLAYPMLDEDVYRVGIGGAFFNTLRSQPRNVLFRIDFDELFGDGFNSHTFSAKVIYVF
jgi:outer membrane autotransporter protein